MTVACLPLILTAPRPSATCGIASFPVALMLPDSSNCAVAIFACLWRSPCLGSLVCCCAFADTAQEKLSTDGMKRAFLRGYNFTLGHGPREACGTRSLPQDPTGSALNS